MKWLRNKLRDWLLDPPAPASKPKTLTCVLDGEVRTCAVVGVIGLTVQVVYNRGTQLISEAQVANREEFWECWRGWNTQELYLEDGTVFTPPC